MKYDSAEEVLAEIRRVAPIYRDVTPGGENAVWDVSRFSLPPAPATANGCLATPATTQPLDYLHVRFERWFDGLFAGQKSL